MTQVKSVHRSLTVILSLILTVSFSCKSPSQSQSNLSQDALDQADQKMQSYVEEERVLEKDAIQDILHVKTNYRSCPYDFVR